jgi:hypothetical protein
LDLDLVGVTAGLSEPAPRIWLAPRGLTKWKAKLLCPCILGYRGKGADPNNVIFHKVYVFTF